MNGDRRRLRLWVGFVAGGLVLGLFFGLTRLALGIGVSSTAPLAGSLDRRFGNGGIVTHTLGAGVRAGIGGIAVQRDGRVVVASSGFLLARYLPDGSLDQSFGEGGYVATGVGSGGYLVTGYAAYAVALQPDGRIVVAGSSGSVSNSVSREFAVARYEPDGSPDASFGSDGLTKTTIPQALYCGGSAGARARALVILPDGDILAGGSVEGSDCDIVGWSSLALVRYASDGSLDPTFGDAGIAPTGFSDVEPSPSAFGGIAVQPDGKIVATGSTGTGGHGRDTYESMALARYEPDGSFDLTFGTAGRVTTPEMTVDPTRFRLRKGGPATLQHGKILVAGTTCVLDNCSWVPVLARYEASGRLDSTFGQHGFAEIKPDLGAPSAMLAQADGKILIAGNASSQGRVAVARLLPNGRLDKSFGKGGIVSLRGRASTLALQANGKILVGGGQGNVWTLTRLIGGNNCVVPGLRGRTISKASATLKKSYCRRGHISRRYSSDVIRGRVISTAPPYGTRLHGGAKIDLLVSKGKRP